MSEAYIFDAIRSPRSKGKADGSLHQIKPIDLGAQLLSALQQRHDLNTAYVDDVMWGCVTPVAEQGSNIAKATVQQAQWGESVAGFQLDRFCASGLEAVNTAAQKVMSGWSELVVAGGVESMSRVPMGSNGGAMFCDPEFILRHKSVPQGVGADLIATLGGWNRQAVDEFALQSQLRAAHARDNGFFKNSIVPIVDRNGLPVLTEDDFIKPNTSLEALAGLRASFAQIGGMGADDMLLSKYPEVAEIDHVHTPGNSSGIVDGAAAVLIGSQQAGHDLGLKPRAKIRAGAVLATEPSIMLTGPAPAAEKCLKIAGLSKQDIDLWEINEAFAAVALRYMQDLSLDPNIVNVNGGAIAMGHPLGATGAMLIGIVLDELERRDQQFGMVSLCVGGGMGISTIIERV